MDNLIPFPIREYGGRPHQAAQYDKRGAPVPSDAAHFSGVCIEHVRDGKALTAKGALLLKRSQERPS